MIRVLADLSLPSSFLKDITQTFKPLHLLTLTSEITTYTPRACQTNNPWWVTGIPSALRRLLALILLCLKFHFSLDDQFEYYHSHNIDIIRKHQSAEILKLKNLQELASEKYFDAQEWIRFR